MRVSVIGCGHLGIPHAAAMAELGHEVIGVDVDQAKVDRLNAGECPIYETGLPELLARRTASGRLRFTTSIREAAEFAELHFIGVGTPIDADGRSYDTAQVYGAIRQLAPHLNRPCTIVGKSTVTVGTTSQVTALAQRLAPAGTSVDVVWNPEFLREGHAVEDTLRPDRIVAGLTTAEGEKAIRAVYAPILDAGVPIFVTDPQTAELAKGAANTFLGLKISYINAVADMCEAAGGDVSQIVEILGIDRRIGSGGMRPGIGYGGGCLPKDVRAFTASARQLGADQAAALLRAAEKINETRTDVALDLVTRALGNRPITDAQVTVWGAAFKPGTNDVRESPVLALAHALQQAGATVTIHDPQAVTTAMIRNPEFDYTDDLPASLDGADLVVLATEWPEYRQADPQTLVDRPANPLLVDCRTTLDPEPWRASGWTVHQLGRPGK
ncbi:nucleotide sugar dehydrogenase [Streptomyces sp. SID4946]|uniref:UDP-glucose dehydrogenase family protein n=1 Tax=Streptomyces sp. LamerLS-31b TaxID=1839765 RepID=UPI00081DCADA|nr:MULTISPECIES: UDP-glucose/GDP-mannose dehydrogenase family protein [unclassified Streptomyces]MYQ96740.1 nucleotide sugar dehydrogenase [Streptomyces sp. SID4946]SCF98652.1 UDPglucose 6-dehydrogenase [Streptomyces sp. LamerLS-31b]SCG01866.1 UDPglucose 6-dehydrogenase [Streptomyces sp. DconLS]